MEEIPNDDEDEERPKLPSLVELLKKGASDKGKAGKDIASSLFGERPVSKPEDTQAETETNPSDRAEETPESNLLTPEQEAVINSRIAAEHLEEPVTPDPPQPPVRDFLRMVVNRVKPDAAFESTLADNNLGQPPPPETIPASEPKPAPGPAEITPDNRDQLPTAPNLPPPVIETVKPVTPRKTAEKRPRETTTLAAELAKLIVGQRGRAERQTATISRNPKTTEREPKTIKHEQQVEKKVVQMERSLTRQEHTLQKLSLEKTASERITSSLERTQPGRSESRLGMVKPERAGHIGKVVIEKERQPVAGSEPAKTMRRDELLALSDKITVEGASLRHMFDNHLFGEGALRRLVGANLEGRDLQPLLRREVLERQIDYERDPILRDRGSQSDSGGGALFAQMLASADAGQANPKPTQSHGSTRSAAPKAKSRSDKAQQTRYPLGSVLLAATIAVLLGIILYLLLK